MGRKKKVLKCPKSFEVGQKFMWYSTKKTEIYATIVDISPCFLYLYRTNGDKVDIVMFEFDSFKSKLNSDLVTWIQSDGVKASGEVV